LPGSQRTLNQWPDNQPSRIDNQTEVSAFLLLPYTLPYSKTIVLPVTSPFTSNEANNLGKVVVNRHSMKQMGAMIQQSNREMKT
jgi:hypothetical protein